MDLEQHRIYIYIYVVLKFCVFCILILIACCCLLSKKLDLLKKKKFCHSCFENSSKTSFHCSLSVSVSKQSHLETKLFTLSWQHISPLIRPATQMEPCLVQSAATPLTFPNTSIPIAYQSHVVRLVTRDAVHPPRASYHSSYQFTHFLSLGEACTFKSWQWEKPP